MNTIVWQSFSPGRLFPAISESDEKRAEKPGSRAGFAQTGGLSPAETQTQRGTKNMPAVEGSFNGDMGTVNPGALERWQEGRGKRWQKRTYPNGAGQSGQPVRAGRRIRRRSRRDRSIDGSNMVTRFRLPLCRGSPAPICESSQRRADEEERAA